MKIITIFFNLISITPAFATHELPLSSFHKSCLLVHQMRYQDVDDSLVFLKAKEPLLLEKKVDSLRKTQESFVSLSSKEESDHLLSLNKKRAINDIQKKLDEFTFEYKRNFLFSTSLSIRVTYNYSSSFPNKMDKKLDQALFLAGIGKTF